MSNTSNAKASGRPVADHVDPPVAKPAPTPTEDAKATSVEESKARDTELLKPVDGLSDEEIDVKTSGAFMLMDPQTGKQFVEDEGTTTRQTPFVVAELATGRLVKA